MCSTDSLSLSLSSLSIVHSLPPPSLHPCLSLPPSLPSSRSLAGSDSPTLCISHEAATHGRNSSRQSPKTGNGRYLNSLAIIAVLLFIFLILDCTTLRIWNAKHSTRWAWSGRSAFLVVQKLIMRKFSCSHTILERNNLAQLAVRSSKSGSEEMHQQQDNQIILPRVRLHPFPAPLLLSHSTGTRMRIYVRTCVFGTVCMCDTACVRRCVYTCTHTHTHTAHFLPRSPQQLGCIDACKESILCACRMPASAQRSSCCFRRRSGRRRRARRRR